MSEQQTTALVVRDSKGQIAPGSPPVCGPGRPKGARNRITRELDGRYEVYLLAPAEEQQNWFVLHPEDKTNPLIYQNWVMAWDESAKKELKVDCARNLCVRYDEPKVKPVAVLPEPTTETAARTAKITAAIRGLFLDGLVVTREIGGPSHG